MIQKILKFRSFCLLELIFGAILFLYIPFIMGCNKKVYSEFVLIDFETSEDLDKLHWKCHSLFNISDNNVTHGRNSLRMELYPSEYPGLSPVLAINDWRGYECLSFDMYNPAKSDLRITVRIDDKEDAPEYGDRYNCSFILKPGLNQINIPLNELTTSGTNRYLDLSAIKRLAIFVVKPSEKITLYADYIRLVG